MTPSAQVDPLIGRLVDGRYRVRARIARGGMATVYVATDLRLERRIALKVMHGHLSDDRVFQSRFIQEARAAARLADPNVVNVFDQGQDGDIAYLVMEYLPGITLRELLREQRKLTVPQAISIMDATLSGLAAAHRADIVHRDVKPENILLAEDGRIKIGDFGLARATTANTASGQQLLGTIAYLAPELVTRGTADARSDIYALGIVLYEMLAGEQPYKGEQPMQIAFQHATETVPRPSARNPAVPEQLDELVLWATDKSPDQRPNNAQEMLDRLREIEREIGVNPPETFAPRTGSNVVLPDYDSGEHTKLLPGTFQPSTPTPVIDNATLLGRRSARRRARGRVLLALTLILATLAAGTGWWFGSGPGSLVGVPAVTGMTYDNAAAHLEAEGFVPSRTDEHSITVDPGITIRTDPDEGERLEPGAPVTVVVSSGPAPRTIAPLAGATEDAARTALTDANLRIDDEPEEYFATVPAGTVLNVRITPRSGGEPYACGEGCEVFEDDQALIQLSAGEVADVTGMTVEQATTSFQNQRLVVDESRTEFYDENIAKGRVIGIAERPDGGSWRPGETVHLIVSLGPAPVEVPNVVGMNLARATTILQDAGFRVITTESIPEFLRTLITVTGTDPIAGTSAARGSTVGIEIY